MEIQTLPGLVLEEKHHHGPSSLKHWLYGDKHDRGTSKVDENLYGMCYRKGFTKPLPNSGNEKTRQDYSMVQAI
jgi:hypothetical protein